MSRRSNPSRGPALATLLRESIELASAYLVRTCEPDGRFVYRINTNPAVAPKPRYNVLRHAGAIYALAMRHRWQADEAARDALSRAGRFLLRECVGPIDGQDGLLAVWSRPELTGSSRPAQAKLGGAGLGLVAFASQQQVDPAGVTRDLLRGLGRFILSMQKDDGSFHSKLVPDRGGRQDRWTSLYYPGEAALGLLMLDRLDDDPTWHEAATRALLYLARSRAGERRVPADHWALLATAAWLSAPEPRADPTATSLILQHAAQVCESILREQVWDAPILEHEGGFAADGRTTPTATRLEGLLAALGFLPAEDELHRRISASVFSGVSFLLGAQIRTGTAAGGFPRAVMPLPEDHPGASRSFNERATEVRIDYVQHALCALIQCETLRAADASGSHPLPGLWSP